MKIVHVLYSLEMGGAEVLAAQLCQLQRAQGHEVFVFAYSALGPIGQSLRADGVEVYMPGEAHPLVTMARYYRRLRKIRPDVVHCHNRAPAVQAAPPAWLLGVRSILFTLHGREGAPYDRAAELKSSFAASFCDWVVGICETTCGNLRAAPFSHTKKIVRVYNGAEAVVRTEPDAELASDGFTLLFVGRLEAVKDLGTLLRAVAIAAQQVPGLRFWIVGDGSVRAELEALVEQLGIGATVKFWGQQMQTARFFSAADGFAMSSVSEGLPMSLLQAMSLGLPAVVTDVGGMAEVVRLAQCGLITPVGDADAMAESIVRLATEPAVCDTFRAQGQAAYQAHFTLQQMSAGYLALYTDAGSKA